MKRIGCQIWPIIFIIVTLLAGCEEMENDPGLTKKEWTVVSITNAGSLTPQQAENTYTFEFINDTIYELKLDVNHCAGKYSIPEKGKIDFRGAACTEVCCDSEYAKKMASMFPGMTSYRMESGFLILTGEGEIMLR